MSWFLLCCYLFPCLQIEIALTNNRFNDPKVNGKHQDEDAPSSVLFGRKAGRARLKVFAISIWRFFRFLFCCCSLNFTSVFRTFQLSENRSNFQIIWNFVDVIYDQFYSFSYVVSTYTFLQLFSFVFLFFCNRNFFQTWNPISRDGLNWLILLAAQATNGRMITELSLLWNHTILMKNLVHWFPSYLHWDECTTKTTFQ